jgi:hypothetical protein
MQIDFKIYDLFIRHGSECIWTYDHRVRRPKGTSPETDDMFAILEYVDHRFEMIHTGMYSAKLVSQYRREISMVKHQISPEVFQLIERKYNENATH